MNMSMSYISTSMLVSTVPVSCHCQVTPGLGIQTGLPAVAPTFALGAGTLGDALAPALPELGAPEGAFAPATPELGAPEGAFAPATPELDAPGLFAAALAIGPVPLLLPPAPAAPPTAAAVAFGPAFGTALRFAVATGAPGIELTPLADCVPARLLVSAGPHPSVENIATNAPAIQTARAGAEQSRGWPSAAQTAGGVHVRIARVCESRSIVHVLSRGSLGAGAT
jgi:hypothetical protein